MNQELHSTTVDDLEFLFLCGCYYRPKNSVDDPVDDVEEGTSNVPQVCV